MGRYIKASKNIVWDYAWDDGAYLELVETDSEYILYEFDEAGNRVEMTDQVGYSLVKSDCICYPKSQFTLGQVIADIEEDYDIYN